jgi:hypothetical protein
MTLQMMSSRCMWRFALMLAIAIAATAPASAQSRVKSGPRQPTTAVRSAEFLESIGVCSAVSRRGEDLANTIKAARYIGLGWVRAGYESDIPVADLIELHRRAGVRSSYGLASGGTDLARLLDGARRLAAAEALLALEGNNEPNNWGITYQGQTGGRDKSWVPVAKLQRDLYKAVKGDPVLKKYPVWSISEGGAEVDNVGLQFLTIPSGAGTVMPAGTKYADYANVHNYFYHPNSAGLEDNKTWLAADPGPACRVDGLYGEYGRTWARHYAGYSEAELVKLPRVTTETGTTIGGAVTEEIHALNLMSVYLDQFKRGWSYTSVYLLRDRSDEAGNQQFGFYKPDYTPRKAALYLHNLTTILADRGSIATPGKLSYSIPKQPATVHDLLLQKSDGTFDLVVWGERIKGADSVKVELGRVYSSVKIFDPTNGVAASRVVRNVDAIDLTLTDHPVILEIRN